MDSLQNGGTMVLRMKRCNLLCVACIALCLTAALPSMLLGQTSSTTTADQKPDPLGRLTQALSDAGATALTTAQETALKTLITDFQTANQATPSSTRLAYESYILAGQADQAIALIPALQQEQAVQALARTQAEITFAVSVVKALSPSQLSLLQQDLGTDELVRLIQSLAGGPGHPGGGPGGPPMR
jgi:Spy/CpxP family protein refolding chaperone